MIASRNAMTTAEWRALAVSGALNKEQALRLITLGKIKSGQAGHITQLLNISKAELQVAMSAGKARVAMTMLSYGAKQVWTAFKGLFNPYMYLFAGLLPLLNYGISPGKRLTK